MKTLIAAMMFLISVMMFPSAQAQPITMNGDCHVFYSPKGGITDVSVMFIGMAKKTVRVAAYSFTSQPIADALVGAHKRGVDVQVTIDSDSATGVGNKISVLTDAGIPVYSDGAHAIAHDKVMVVDDTMFQTGSFNYSTAAETKNGENAIFCPSPSGAAEYLANWENHKGHSKRIQ